MMEQPPIQPTPVGALRFNTDNNRLEYFDGNEYKVIITDSPEQHVSGTRGIFYSGNLPSTNVIQFVNIATTGNAENFGDAVQIGRVAGCFSSRTRCFKANGYADGGTGGVNVIEFVTFSSQGDATNFGDSTARTVSYTHLTLPTSDLV